MKLKKPSKKLLIILGCVVGLVLILLIALPLIIDVNRYRGLIENTAQEALGREVRLGEMNLSLLPSVAVRIDDLAIGALPEEGEGDLLTARRLRIGARLLPLLRKQLKVTSIVVEAPQLTLVRDSQGRWNVQRLVATEAPAQQEIGQPAATGPPEFEVGSLRITKGRLDLRDEVSGSTPLQATLTHLDINLKNVNPARSLDFALSGRFNDSGRFKAEGQIGPLGGESGGVPLNVALSLDPIPANLLPLAAGEGFELDTRSGTASLSLDLSGHAPDLLRARGTTRLSGFKARFADPTGELKELSLDMEAQYDLTARHGGAELQIDTLVLDLLGSHLSVRGTIERVAPLHRVDVELLPTSVTAEQLAGLLGMVIGELPVSFASDAPIELQARVKGLVGEGHIPQIEGDAKLQGFSFMHPSLDQPLTQVGANVALRGDSVQIEGLSGVVGSSDFAGDVSVVGFEAPRVAFNLHSKQADFGELFSFLKSEQEGQSTSGAGGEKEQGQDALSQMILEGKINIERGSFDTLKFKALQAQMRWDDGILTMRPVNMQLYDGEFQGEIISDLSGSEPSFDIRGDAQGVDMDGFLGDNLDSAGLLYGRFFGSVKTQTVGADYASIIGGLNGQGTVEVLKGRIGGLDILETLSKVSGVFGEDTLRSLSSRLAAEGTAFNTLSGGVRFESGNMLFDGLLLDSPDFKLQGVGAVDLLNAKLKGDFRLNLSRQLSASMRAESSRAGELFWNGSSRQVEVPFSLSGPFTVPSPSVDWNAVAETAVKGRAEEEILKYLEEKFGGKTEEETTPESPPEKALPKDSDSGGPIAGLAVEISKVDWGGSFLAPDLEVEGFVHGTLIDRAEVFVVDSQGAQMRHDRLGDVDRFVASGSQPTTRVSIPWKYEVDGKKLLLAKFPVTLRVIVHDVKGASSETVTQVNR